MTEILNVEEGLKVVSDVQNKANHENAQKSTGPKDTSNTRFNAVKHGLLSQKTWKIMSDNERETLSALKMEIMEEFNRPLTIFDKILIEKFIVSYWRIRRAQEMQTIYMKRAEQGCIKKDFDRNSIVNLLETPIPEHLDDGLTKEDLIFSRLDEQTELMRRYTVSAENEFYRALNELEKRLNRE